MITVKDETTRRPVAGATVESWVESGFLPRRTTDADGRVDLTDLPDGRVGALVTAHGYAPSDPEWKTVGDGIVLALHFELQPAVAVEGIVVARDGGDPVEGARVAAVRGWMVGRSELAFDETTSDANGGFRLAAVPRVKEAQDGAVLVVERDGFATTDVVVTTTPSDAALVHVRVALVPGASVGGRVLDADGAPLAEARIEAHPGGARWHFHLTLGFGQSRSFHADGSVTLRRALAAESDAEGRFEVTGLVRGETYTLLAGQPDGSITEAVEVCADAGIAPVELRVRRSGALVVRVADGDGNPIEGAEVHLNERGADLRATEPGVWRADVVHHSSAYLFVQAPGFVLASRSVEVAPGRTRTVRIKLKPAFHLSGTVVDDAGAPVAGASVWAEDSPDVMDDAGLPDSQETDAAGRFRLEDLPGKKHRVMVRGPRHVPAVLRGVRPPADDLVLVAPRAMTVRVRFEVPAGQRRPGEVHVLHAPLPRRGRAPDRFSEKWRSGAFALEDGATEIVRVPPPRAVLRLLVPGFQRVERIVEGTHGETVDLGTIVLEPPIDIDGRVVDSDGRPVAGVNVHPEQPWAHDDEHAWTVRATTAEDGTFRLRGLWRGRVKLLVQTGPLFPAGFDVDVGDGRPVTLTIPAGDPHDIAGELGLPPLLRRGPTGGGAPRRGS